MRKNGKKQQKGLRSLHKTSKRGNATNKTNYLHQRALKNCAQIRADEITKECIFNISKSNDSLIESQKNH